MCILTYYIECDKKKEVNANYWKRLENAKLLDFSIWQIFSSFLCFCAAGKRLIIIIISPFFALPAHLTIDKGFCGVFAAGHIGHMIILCKYIANIYGEKVLTNIDGMEDIL